MDNHPDIAKRGKLILFFVFAWAGVALLFLFHHTVLSGKNIASKNLSSVHRTYRIPARRGAILDASGMPLVWSEMRLSIYQRRTVPSEAIRQELSNSLKSAFGEFDESALDTTGPEHQLVCEIPPRYFAKVPPLLKKFRFLGETSSEIRIFHHGLSPAAQEKLGKTRLAKSRIVGISGLELQYDSSLKSTPGIAKVMIDKYGRWIPGTWREVVKPKNGKDVRLPWKLKNPTQTDPN